MFDIGKTIDLRYLTKNYTVGESERSLSSLTPIFV